MELPPDEIPIPNQSDSHSDSDRLPSLNFRPETDDLRHATSILEAILHDRTVLGNLPVQDRKALLTAAGRVSRPDRLELMKVTKRYRRKERQRQKDADRAIRAKSAIRTVRELPVYQAPTQLVVGGGVGGSVTDEPVKFLELERPHDCYICKNSYTHVHFFYDSLCPGCAKINYAKRFQSASLEGCVALITGARVKIGFQAALMMLRAGATVIVTTRFPHDAAIRFSQVEDFSSWRDRVKIHGLDLRHSPSVELFTQFVNLHYDRLDILINNAAQTVRRPAGFYAHLMGVESQKVCELPDGVQPLLSHHTRLRSLVAPRDYLPESGESSQWLSEWHQKSIGLTLSAALSQIPYDYDEQTHRDLDVFPLGKTDADLQQVDLRSMNSWRMTLGDVPTPEMLEVQLINSVAPFILCSRLKPLMLRERTWKKHIVNVSAMEGKFARYTKTDKHPHTNMAKAALNMMTLTSAPDYARDGIYMNAVDTGWVTDEDPIHHAVRKQKEHDFQPPLDIVDGAARICDPFFSGYITGNHVWGKFLKDYRSTEW